MDSKPIEKQKKLEQYFSGLKGVCIAFSGGVDSSYLLKVAHDVLQDNVWAFTIDTVYIPSREIDEARKFALKHKINHQVIAVPLIDIVRHNPNDRCYFCKTFIFKKILNEAQKLNISHVAEGTNADDVQAYRPGIKALDELKVLSPLKELGFTKQDIRDLSRGLGLPTWNKPAYACLLTRIPYGNTVNPTELKRIEASEKYLAHLGFDGVRVRSHDNLARIEVLPEHMDKILNMELLKNITNELKNLGFQFVTLDTEGYKPGSFDHAKQTQ
jgi:pyridinium-3,5-biscarboxylic acid mononucleotide sulfurtransferase